MEVVTIEAFDRSYQINNPGSGRVGSKLNNGEPYEKRLLVDIKQRGFRGTVFDIGAHIGNHSLWFAAICGMKVIAWEPHEESRKQLIDNLTLNPSLDITVLDWAAGRSISKGKFTEGMWLEFDPDRDGANLRPDRGEIPIYPIDYMVDFPSVSVVKVDVEGMEPDVLAGMEMHLARSHPWVYAETHTPQARERIGNVLEPLGYRLNGSIRMGSTMDRWAPIVPIITAKMKPWPQSR